MFILALRALALGLCSCTPTPHCCLTGRLKLGCRLQRCAWRHASWAASLFNRDSFFILQLVHSALIEAMLLKREQHYLVALCAPFAAGLAGSSVLYTSVDLRRA